MNKFIKLFFWVSLGFSIQLAITNDALAQPPGLIEAVKIATDDFEKRLADDHQDWEYAAYVSDIRNYGIGFAEADDYYVVIFRLKATKEKINGGGGKYLVGKRDMRIIKFIGYE